MSATQGTDDLRAVFGAVAGAVDPAPGMREWVAENLYTAIFEAESAWRCTEIADDMGLKYHVARLAAHARQVIETTNELQRLRKGVPRTDEAPA